MEGNRGIEKDLHIALKPYFLEKNIDILSLMGGRRSETEQSFLENSAVRLNQIGRGLFFSATVGVERAQKAKDGEVSEKIVNAAHIVDGLGLFVLGILAFSGNFSLLSDYMIAKAATSIFIIKGAEFIAKKKNNLPR